MSIKQLFTLNFLVCLLGNFVDQFDLYLFSSLRIISLQSLGLTSDQILNKGVLVLNAQIAGLLLGGIIAGILGDKRGRFSILFGSIILYSLANIANAFVTDVNHYIVCRFFAGLGLAGELGVCITVLLETLPIKLRGPGIMLLMAFGHAAAILSSLCARFFEWRTCYLIGGVLGLAILLLRASANESELYRKIQSPTIQKGQFLKLISRWSYFKRYIKGVLISTPAMYTYGILIIFAPELGKELGIREPIRPEVYLPYNFAAVVVGDLCCGLLGQHFKTRRWVIFAFLIGLAFLSTIYLLNRNFTLFSFYLLLSVFGFFAGFAVLSYTVAAEQFGTNLRSTVATSTPNLARASAIVFTTAFTALKSYWGAIQSAAFIGAFAFFFALIAAVTLEETYGKNLDFIE